jgi:hypothetical protein
MENNKLDSPNILLSMILGVLIATQVEDEKVYNALLYLGGYLAVYIVYKIIKKIFY